MPLCDFLLVFRCNYVPIFYRFRDITIHVHYSQESPFFVVLPITVSFEVLAEVFPWDRGYESRYQKLESEMWDGEN